MNFIKISFGAGDSLRSATPIGTAAADDSTTSTTSTVVSVVEIRGPCYNGSDINDTLATNSGSVTIDAGQFAAFFYDIDDNVTTETLSIKNVTEELRYYPYVEKTAGNVTT